VFDKQIAISAGTECADALRKATVDIEKIIKSGTTQEKVALFTKFGIRTDFYDGDFMYVMSQYDVSK